MYKKLVGAAEKAFTWINLVTGLTVMGVGGVISNYMAAKTTWIAQAGPYGVWIATLAGMLLIALIGAACVKVRGWYEDEKLKLEWRRTPRAVNPVELEFHKVRINLSDIANPLTRRVKKKRFVDCEIMGPANIYFHGNGNLVNNEFLGCDICVGREGKINNVLVIEDCEFIGCKFYLCTVFITENLIDDFEKMNARFVTFTGRQEIDSRPRK